MKMKSNLDLLFKFLKNKGYSEIIVEVFKGGIENGEIFIEGEVKESLKFNEVEELMRFLRELEIERISILKRSAYLLTNGRVLVIHGISFKNFL